MSALPAPAGPQQTEALRLVLFGLPNAGKSSLLGALGQAMQTREAGLHGQIKDVSDGLQALRRRLYDDEPQRTADEIVSYAVVYRPREGSATPAVFMDSDGRAANELLAGRRSLEEDHPAGNLAGALRRADTLILVVDAAAPSAQVEAEFAEFTRFLKLLQEGRGQRVEIAGLPIFLVLAKCDLLARAGDATIDWTERIEQRKSEAATRLHDVLAHEAAPSFGRLDVHVWATAVKRPALQGIPARDREPYLVAELFRQCLDEASRHRLRLQHSRSRLLWTAGGAAGLLAALLSALAGFFVAGAANRPSPLQLQIDTLMFTDRPTAVERLRGSLDDLRERLEEFAQIRQDPTFGALPSRYRDFVGNRRDELAEYIAYTDKLRQARLPANAVTDSTLRDIKNELTTTLALPRVDWAATEAGRARQERLDECEALFVAVAKTRDWYLDDAGDARTLTNFTDFQGTPETPGINWRPWLDDVEKSLAPARGPPFSENEPLPGAPTLTYQVALHFDGIVEARAAWESARQKLARVRDLCAAVGLVTGVQGKPPLLLIPRTGFTLAAADLRLRDLQTAYPKYRTDFVRAGLPDAMLPELSRAVQASYEYALEPARAAVLGRLRQAGPGTDETLSRWAPVRSWLAHPQELAAWRVLAVLLLRLQDAKAPDPVADLAAFLQKTSFTIDIKSAVLEVPDSIKAKPLSDAALTVNFPQAGSNKPALVLKMTGNGERSAHEHLWRYTFQLQEGGVLVYRPGDELSATLPLRGDMVFTWSRCRSALYQFERLHRPPQLHKTGQEPTDATPADKVRLLLTPADGVPQVPDLLPAVRGQLR